MKAGKAAGLVFSITGILAGGYFGISPVLEALAAQQISGNQAGTYFASICIIVGATCATIGIISNRATGST